MDALSLLRAIQAPDALSAANIIYTVHTKDPKEWARSFNTLAELFVFHPELCTTNARKMLTGLAVDAFLNHDYVSSLSFFKLACFNKHIESAGGAEKFFQQTLSSNRLQPGCTVEICGLKSAPQYNGMDAHVLNHDQAKDRWGLKLPTGDEISVKPTNLIVKAEPPGAMTPWGTPALHRLRPGQEPSQLTACVEEVRDLQTNEMYLLRALQAAVPCSCLDVEDPMSARFGHVLDPTIPPPDIPTAAHAGRRSAYGHDCLRCRAPPAPGAEYKKCSRCRMVRYCSPDCQRADWDRHKLRCVDPARAPAWWGTMTSIA